MNFRLKLAHRTHSGRLRPHEYTSYAPLTALLIVVGLILTVCTAFAQHPGPQSGSIGLSGTLLGKPPTTAATITSPSNGQRFSESPVTVAGACSANDLVEIYKNNIFGGSTICSQSGNYNFDVDLLVGQNSLVARIYNDANQAGPDSNTVSVFYTLLPTQNGPITPLNIGSSQMVLTTDAAFREIFPGQALTVPLQIVGGVGPYAVNVQWNDGSNNTLPHGDNSALNMTHTYAKPGVYRITIQATDSTGRVAFLTVAAIVNGQATGAATGTNNSGSGTSGGVGTKLLVLWPLYSASFAVVLSFWLGEKREKRVLAYVPAGGGIQYRN